MNDLITGQYPVLSPQIVLQDSVTPTSTPIKHLVIIFQENVSFDHYFGTYPNATNPPDEPKFVADPHTPSVNRITAGLQQYFYVQSMIRYSHAMTSLMEYHNKKMA